MAKIYQTTHTNGSPEIFSKKFKQKPGLATLILRRLMAETSDIPETLPDDPWPAWFQTHGPRLLLFARQQTRSDTDADDIVQEAALRLWKSGSPPPDLPLAFTAVRHTAIDHARRNKRRLQREQTATANDTLTKPWFEPQLPSEETAAVQQAIANLPEKHRNVITLKIWGELTFAQIADTLDISPNTAASRYRYALDHLRRHFAQSTAPANLCPSPA